MLLAITCAIPNIDNGAITCQDSAVAEYNEQCSVSCNDGFIGNASSVTCENSGDLEPTTVCQGQYFYPALLLLIVFKGFFVIHILRTHM